MSVWPLTETEAPRLWDDETLTAQAAALAEAPDLIERALALGQSLSSRAALLGRESHAYFATLAALARGDLTVARTIEPHLDALTILGQAGELDLGRIGADADSTWGVFAAAAPGHEFVATAEAGGVTISGSKAWCSLADRVTHALVTARVGEETALFAVPLRHPGVQVDSTSWVSRGLAQLRTSVVTCTGVPAVPVGGPGWYLQRPGFAWGGMAVAAIWFGGAEALAGALLAAAERREPDQIALAHIGAADRALHTARTALDHAAARIDAGKATGEAGAVLALRTRSAVAGAAEKILTGVGHALGPGPLTGNETHARRVADLTVYIRQHHAERDLAVLGRHVVRVGAGPAS